MPSFRRRDSVIDADRVDPPPQAADRPLDAEQARALAEEAEAEAAEAEAMAAAARARARAIRLRREAGETVEVDDHSVEVEPEPDAELIVTEAVDPEPIDTEAVDPEPIDTEPVDPDTGDEAIVEESAPAGRRTRRLPRPGWKGLLAALVIVCTAALLAVSGYMVWHHREAVALQQLDAEYTAAGRQSVVTLMSLDFNQAQEDVQRIIDNSTGQFKTDFEQQAADFVEVARASKVITEVTVNSVAVESMTEDSAVVLVAASSRVTNSEGANQEPRTWRLSVDLQREGDQIKMSKVEFVP
ncbi:putative protein [Mycolicibacterium vanbaalenii]|uniref:VirB8 protein n=1 Tax=Mycolicibacterium vanbaalenii TaxID=110539 RepID=A0A5S9R879_MYCVN|nr:hypothetical protein [Mycolicibacterium vanbaalenii]CAA0130830.1 putative protein [Mycolicibacterium vanbaalenii]